MPLDVTFLNSVQSGNVRERDLIKFLEGYLLFFIKDVAIKYLRFFKYFRCPPHSLPMAINSVPVFQTVSVPNAAARCNVGSMTSAFDSVQQIFIYFSIFFTTVRHGGAFDLSGLRCTRSIERTWKSPTSAGKKKSGWWDVRYLPLFWCITYRVSCVKSKK